MEWGLVSLAHNLRKYVARKAKERDKYAQSMKISDEISLLKAAIWQSEVLFQSMAGRGLVSGSLTTESEGWMKRSGTLAESSDCNIANLYNKKGVTQK